MNEVWEQILTKEAIKEAERELQIVSLTKLSKREKEELMYDVEWYLQRIKKKKDAFADSGRPALVKYGYDLGKPLNEVADIDKIHSAFERCMNKEDTLTDIIKCVKDQTDTYIIPESVNRYLSEVLAERRAVARTYKV